mmetsp:Transcript_1975/g.2767  ORF Transcript_1975/g.2767 Transcript_1975/m.2767 type:complete len:186 (+) Transcript_1975:104-661(+)
MKIFILWILFVISISSDALPGHHDPLVDWDINIHTKRGKLGGEPIYHAVFPSESSAQKARRSFDCRLALHQNKTFSLTPKDTTIMPIHGRWKLGKNPYCPTDRFYDDLLLTSYPRVQKRQDIELQRVVFQFKCRIYGRYYDEQRAKISHGTLLWKDKSSKDEKKSLRNRWEKSRVCATFLGRPAM